MLHGGVTSGLKPTQNHVTELPGVGVKSALTFRLDLAPSQPFENVQHRFWGGRRDQEAPAGDAALQIRNDLEAFAMSTGDPLRLFGEGLPEIPLIRQGPGRL